MISFRHLFSLSPNLYATCYFAMMPLFAILYGFQEGGFYHSTIEHEQSYDLMNSEITNVLFAGIRNNFLEKQRANFIISGEKLLEIDNCQAYNLSMNEEEWGGDKIKRVIFNVTCNTKITGQLLNASIERRIEEKKKREKEGLPLGIYEHAEDSFDTSYVNEYKLNFVYPTNGIADPAFIMIERIASIQDFPTSTEIFPGGTYETGAVNKKDKGRYAVKIFYDNMLFRKLDSYYKATNGLPYNTKDHWQRMLYLSVVTITTLGYGDIVPITSTARMLIALESVLGIIFIGLFLNSIGSRK